MKKIYAAGPITGMRYEDAVWWRVQAALDLDPHGISVYCPMRGQAELAQMGVIEKQYVGATTLLTNKVIHRRDRWDVETCDLLLANLLGAKRVSIGTMYEIGVADALHKPIVLLMEDEGNPHENELLREVAWVIESNLEDGLDAVRSILLSGDA